MATNCREKTKRRLFQEGDSRRSRSVDSGLGEIRKDAGAPAGESTTQITESEAAMLWEPPTPPRPSRRSLPAKVLPAQQTQRCTSQRATDPLKSPSTLKGKVMEMFRRSGNRNTDDLELSSSYVTGDLWTPTCRGQNLENRPLPERLPDFIRRSFRRKSYRVQKPRSNSPKRDHVL